MSARRWWLINGAGLLVIALGTGLVLMLTGRNTPEQAARAWVDALNHQDFAALYQLSCHEVQQRRGTAPPIEDRGTANELTVVLDAVEQVDDTSAVAAIHLAFQDKSLGIGGRPLDAGAAPLVLRLIKEEGTWKECSEA